MFNRSQLSLAVSAAVGLGFLSLPLPGIAQAPAQQLDRVEVTGSLIRRVEGETALPVVTIRAEDLNRVGVKTAEQAVQFIAQNQSLVNSSGSIGATNGGAAFADLRALGVERTLVLLNGQRVVKNPYLGVATDLNVIPAVAIDRIEVLTDGASSIYGTDAIAGVINIITRRDFQGVNVGASARIPEESGGKQYNANLMGGWGSLARQGFNIFAGVDFTREHRIRAIDRDYLASGIVPEKGLYLTSGTSFPGNYTQSRPAPLTGIATNPTLPGCAPTRSILIPEIFGPNSCRYDFTQDIDLTSDVERWSFLTRGSMAFGQNHVGSLEYFRAYNKVGNNVAPTPLTSLTMPPTNPFYPGGSAGVPITNPALDPSRPITVGWRTTVVGPRASELENTTQRLVGEVEGPLGRWNYRVTAHYSDSTVENTFTGGYVSRQAVLNGLSGAAGAPFLNPFGPQSAAGAAYLNANRVLGQVQDIEGKLAGVNGTISGDLFQLPAGPLSAAIGAEYRRDEINFTNNFGLIRQAASSGLELAEDTEGTIKNYAFLAEVNIPVLRDAPFAKSLEFPISVRYDHYDNVGSTTNPKVGVRWQTTDNLLVRGSYNKGFRAPSVFDLFAPNSVTFTSNPYNDPVLCPGGNPTPNADPNRDCGQQFRQLQGGNLDVEPEKSTAWSAGLVFDLTRSTSFSVDFFQYKVRGTIDALPETAIFGDVAGYANKFVRCSQLTPARRAQIDPCTIPDVVDPLAYVITTTENLGDIKTSGFDVAFNTRTDPTNFGRFTFRLNGTYLTKWEQQLVAGGEFFNPLGRYSEELNFPVPRWQHVIQVGWEHGVWSATLFNRFKKGYTDFNLFTLDDDIYGQNTVGNWSVFDLTATYGGVRNLTVTGGVLNLLNRRAPFSNQGATFQAGYDPRISDPVGRAYFIQASYQFK
jgi:iron complex outermembrane recepter protein